MAVVNKLSPMVLVAKDHSFTILDREDIPDTNEKKTSGTTTSIKRFLKICPPRLKMYFSTTIDIFSEINPDV